jgi:hypothetical protein
MANWAQNWVNFSGEETQIKALNKMFKAMKETGDKLNEGQLPFFMQKPKQDYFFDIYQDDSETISYTTRDRANILDLIEVASYFDLNFECTYLELGNKIFGKAIYTSGNSEAKTYDLEDADFELYDFGQDNDRYIYNGEEYESEEEILMDIFKQKFNFDYQ